MSTSVPDLLKTAADKCGCGQDDLHRFAEHLQALPVHEAARINPFRFADGAGVDPERTLDVFVHGAKLGLVDLEWGMICPLCGAITHSVAALDNVAEDVVHCSLCRRDADAALDDTVEVSFAYSPPGAALDLHADFTTYQHYYTSSSYPYLADWGAYHERHTAADAKLAAGEEATVHVSLKPGTVYRLLCLDVHSGVELRIEEAASWDAANTVDVSLSEEGFSRSTVSMSPGDGVISIKNQTDQRVWCRLLEMNLEEVMAIIRQGPPKFGPRLTGKHLLNNQAFRDTFALHELAPDLKLKLRSLTLLFTDLKGSTALYDREGDLAAYRLVQDHFVALKQVVRDHSGAMIKTMGDAVMAAFPSAEHGTAAAISMMAAMQELAGVKAKSDVGLKVGLHAGPALAINAGQSLDYFGQTVNIAARVQGLADAGDICLTGALNDNAAVPELLSDAGYDSSTELAQLKGVSAEEQIYRYRSAV